MSREKVEKSAIFFKGSVIFEPTLLRNEINESVFEP